MSGQPIRVLLVEDNPIDSAVTARRLLSGSPVPYQLTQVRSLHEACSALEREAADVVLADLNLPDSEGLDTLALLRSCAPQVPVVVLTGHSDHAMGVRAVQMGAQDFLQKGNFDPPIIQRAVLYAIERHRLVRTLHDLSLLDPLTGLYNRRGLFAVSGKRVEVALRLGCRAFILYADLDELKRVNDEHGHAAGDTYVQIGAEAMKQSFRAADVIARVGGDEFVVLGLEATSFDPAVLATRIQRVIERLAREHNVPHEVSISCGAERFDPKSTSIEQAMVAADTEMYRSKRSPRPAEPA
jgi:diguanylate cyclase (GGDEF)-like protein